MIKYLFFAVLLLTSGCTLQPSTENNDNALSFVDRETFDSTLSKAMSVHQENISVMPTSAFSVRQLPERLSCWLKVVLGYQGQVNAAPQSGHKTLSFTAIVGLFPTDYEYLKEALYMPAQNYNAVVFYEPATEQVQQVLFTKKSGSSSR